MKMYVWNSDFLFDWTSGMCAVLADTVEQAREVVRAAAEADKTQSFEEDPTNEAYAQIHADHVARIMDGVSGKPDEVFDAPGASWIHGGS